MKTVSVALLLLLLLSGANVAQDVPTDDNKVDNVHLLGRYLKAEGAEKESLRKRLVALTTPQLQAAIAGLKFEKPEKTGVTKHYTKCPDGHERPYWVYLPESYDPAISYPMMVLLHGGVNAWPMENKPDEDGTHNVSPGEYMVDLYRTALPEEMKSQMILLGCSAGVPQTGEKAAWWHETGQQNVLHMVRDAKRRLNIDDDKVVLSGISDGGSGSFGFAYRHPDVFAGYYSMIGHPLVAMADGTPVWFENLHQADIYSFNGGKDTLYPAAKVKELFEQMKKARLHFFVNEYEDLGHEVQPVIKDDMEYYFKHIWPRLKRTPFSNLLDWTCASNDRGHCRWVQVTEIMDLGKASANIPNYKIELPTPRVRLGVTLVQNSSPPKVEAVQPESLAERMGIKAGDEIVKLDDNEIKTFQDLANALGGKAPEDKVKVGLKRGDEQLTVEGQFDKAAPPPPEPLSARVRGFYSEKFPGSVTLTVRNTGKVKVHVHPQMVEGGFVKVDVFSGLEGMKSKHFAVKPDNDYILRRFEESGDRKLPFICEVEVDVATLLGARPAPEDE